MNDWLRTRVDPAEYTHTSGDVITLAIGAMYHVRLVSASTGAITLVGGMFSMHPGDPKRMNWRKAIERASRHGAGVHVIALLQRLSRHEPIQCAWHQHNTEG